jgi:ribosomal protein L44E
MTILDQHDAELRVEQQAREDYLEGLQPEQQTLLLNSVLSMSYEEEISYLQPHQGETPALDQTKPITRIPVAITVNAIHTSTIPSRGMLTALFRPTDSICPIPQPALEAVMRSLFRVGSKAEPFAITLEGTINGVTMYQRCSTCGDMSQSGSCLICAAIRQWTARRFVYGIPTCAAHTLTAQKAYRAHRHSKTDLTSRQYRRMMSHLSTDVMRLLVAITDITPDMARRADEEFTFRMYRQAHPSIPCMGREELSRAAAFGGICLRESATLEIAARRFRSTQDPIVTVSTLTLRSTKVTSAAPISVPMDIGRPKRAGAGGIRLQAQLLAAAEQEARQ